MSSKGRQRQRKGTKSSSRAHSRADSQQPPSVKEQSPPVQAVKTEADSPEKRFVEMIMQQQQKQI